MFVVSENDLVKYSQELLWLIYGIANDTNVRKEKCIKSFSDSFFEKTPINGLTKKDVHYRLDLCDEYSIDLNMDKLFRFLNDKELLSGHRFIVEMICTIFCDDTRKAKKIFSAKNISSLEFVKAQLSGSLASFMYDALALADPDIITAISCQMYESKPCKGTLSFADKNDFHRSKMVKYTNKVEISISNIKYIRKLLESIQSNQTLMATKNEKTSVWDIVGVAEKQEVGFYIEFNGCASWRLCHALNSSPQNVKTSLFEYRDGIYSYPRNYGIVQKEFKNKLKSVTNRNNLKKLQKIANNVVNCGHGTAIIFIQSDTNGSNEINRIKKLRLGTNINPIDLTTCDQQVIFNMTAVDGAVVVDTNGICHCFGVILDGVASKKGDPSRGARHNSLKHYVEYCKKMGIKAVAVVVSEDRYTEMY